MRRAIVVASTLAFILGALPASAQTSRAPLFAPPSDWTVISHDTIAGGLQSIWQGPLPFNSSDASVLGMWVGSAPIQMMSLVRGRSVASPDEIARSFAARDERYGSQIHYRVTSQKYSFCGLPGDLVNVEFGALMGFGMSYDFAVTQSGGVSYVLSYVHMAGDSDPAAQRALRSLCPVEPSRIQPSRP